MDLHLNGQTAVIGGGASGVGRAAARTFASEGAQVTV
jgi:NAD(P)-dependent dehydrogenase (short-subunit alcohol dehydrogenase family)